MPFAKNFRRVTRSHGVTAGWTDADPKEFCDGFQCGLLHN